MLDLTLSFLYILLPRNIRSSSFHLFFMIHQIPWFSHIFFSVYESYFFFLNSYLYLFLLKRSFTCSLLFYWIEFFLLHKESIKNPSKSNFSFFFHIGVWILVIRTGPTVLEGASSSSQNHGRLVNIGMMMQYTEKESMPDKNIIEIAHRPP